jgi:ParB-like chromosome segregation protein Spo0J
MSKLIYRNPADLRPHPLHQELYGPPTSNDAYQEIRADIKLRGYDERHPLLITEDGRVIDGRTRRAIVIGLKMESVPCEVFVPKDPALAELEIEEEIIRSNMYRTKTETMKAREQRRLLEIETAKGRARMAQGGDGGPSKSTDRVGKLFGESGKSVQRRLKVLEAIEKAEGEGKHQRAKRLTELLDGRKITKALDLLKPQKVREAEQQKKGKAKQDVDRSPTGYYTRAGSDWEAACFHISKAEYRGLGDQLKKMIAQYRAAGKRLREQNP